jgi:hypothetical protein
MVNMITTNCIIGIIINKFYREFLNTMYLILLVYLKFQYDLLKYEDANKNNIYLFGI